MSFSYYNPNERYKRRSWQRVSGFLVIIFVMGCAGFTGYILGHENGLRENTSLADQAKAIAAERDALQNTVTTLRADAQTANARFEELQKTYQSAAPTGPQGDLIALVNKEIADGMDPERIAFLLRSGRPPRNCADPATQRFVVATPAYKGAASQASIASGAIIIKASGASAKNEQGEAEAWYDPSKAISLEFITKDGKSAKKQGVMPISYSAVMEGREYRLTIAEGARSFAKVTFDSCDYP